ncbi:MAG: hypothetical protein ACO23G_13515, partial [Limnohabitans sp.]
NLQVRRGVYGDDSIYVMQTSYYTPGSSNSSPFPGVLVQRYTPSGALDSQYSLRIPNTDLQHIRAVSGGGVWVETTVPDSQGGNQTALQQYGRDGTLNTNFGNSGTLVIPAGSQYLPVTAGWQIINAQGQVTLYGPEGHPVSAGTVPGLTFNAATKTFSIDTSDVAYSTLMAGQTKTIFTHYTVTDQNGTWDEGEVKITVTGDRIYEGASAKGTLNSAGLDQVFIRDTAGDDAVDVNMTQGLRAVGTDSLDRTYVLNWNEVYESSSSGTYPAGSTAGMGFVQVHRFLKTGALDTTYEVNLPTTYGPLSYTGGWGTSQYKIRAIDGNGAVYVENYGAAGTVDTGTGAVNTHALEKYLSSSAGLQSDAKSEPQVNKDTGYGFGLEGNSSVLMGTTDGKFYVRTDVDSDIEITRYNADGTLDESFGTPQSGYKLVLEGIKSYDLPYATINRGPSGVDDHLYVKAWDEEASTTVIKRYTNVGELDAEYVIELPVGIKPSDFRGQDLQGSQYVQRQLSNGTWVLERYSPTSGEQTGSVLDTTFGVNGQIVLPLNATVVTYAKLDQILVFTNTSTASGIPDKIYSASTGASLATKDGWSLSVDGEYVFDATLATYNSLAKDAQETVTLNYKVIDLSSGASAEMKNSSLSFKLIGTNDWPLAQDAMLTATTGSTASVVVSASDADTNAVLTYSQGSRIEGFAPALQSLGLKTPAAGTDTSAYLNPSLGQVQNPDGQIYGFLNNDNQGRLYVWKQLAPTQGTSAPAGIEVVRYSKDGVADSDYTITLPSEVFYSNLRGVSSDGSIYVSKPLSTTSSPSGVTVGMEVLRYKPDGTLDTALGEEGHLSLVNAVQVVGAPTTTGWLYVLEAVPYSSSGVGNTDASASSYLQVHRYNASTGAIDGNFKVNLYDYGSNLQVRRGVYGDDSIYVMQTSYYTPGSSNSSPFPGVLVQRYTPSGALDSQYSLRIPNTDLQHIRAVSGGGVWVETTVPDSQGGNQTALQQYGRDGTLNTNFGNSGTLVIPAGSQYLPVTAGWQIINAQGQVTLYGPEGHPV